MAKRSYEQRRHHRYDVRGVYANLSLPLEVRVLNMSLTGLAIESPVPMGVGGKYHLTLRREHDVIQLQTELQWCRRVRTEPNALGDESPIYEVGFDFREQLNEKARELLGFLQHNVVVELERRRAFGYFRPAGGEQSEAAYQQFDVKQISFSGMRIETGAIPEADAVYEIEIHLDRLELRNRGRVTRVRQVERASGKPLCEVEIAFLDLEPEAQQALEEMVAHFLE